MGLMHEGVVPLERGMKGVLALSGNNILHQTKQHPSQGIVSDMGVRRSDRLTVEPCKKGFEAGSELCHPGLDITVWFVMWLHDMQHVRALVTARYVGAAGLSQSRYCKTRPKVHEHDDGRKKGKGQCSFQHLERRIVKLVAFAYSTFFYCRRLFLTRGF